MVHATPNQNAALYFGQRINIATWPAMGQHYALIYLFYNNHHNIMYDYYCSYYTFTTTVCAQRAHHFILISVKTIS